MVKILDNKFMIIAKEKILIITSDGQYCSNIAFTVRVCFALNKGVVSRTVGGVRS